jgi:hypothetical protein
MRMDGKSIMTLCRQCQVDFSLDARVGAREIGKAAVPFASSMARVLGP